MSAFVLKIIAIAAMVIDHIGAGFEMWFDKQQYEIMRSIGRISFPIFAYLISEGARHTRDIRRYLLRLGIFALVSEIPFDIFNSIRAGRFVFLEFTNQNSILTLFLGALAIYWYETHRMPDSKAVPVHHAVIILLIIMVAPELLKTDYAQSTVALIFLCYFFTQRRWQVLSLAAFAFYEHGKYPLQTAFRYLSGGMAYVRPYGLTLLAGTLVPAILVAFYNDRRGPGFKWFFYIFYPLHFIVLAALIVMRGYNLNPY